MKPILAITPRTDAEWPADHPLRRAAVVMPNEQVKRADGYLICTIVGEERQPPAPDDRDVETTCALCPVRIVHRASAAKHLKPVCWKCWQRITGENGCGNG